MSDWIYNLGRMIALWFKKFNNPPSTLIADSRWKLNRLFDFSLGGLTFPNDYWYQCGRSNACVLSKVNYKDEPPYTYIIWKGSQIAWDTNEKALALITTMNPDAGKQIIPDWGTAPIEPKICSGEIVSWPSAGIFRGRVEVCKKVPSGGAKYWCCSWAWIQDQGGSEPMQEGDINEIDFAEFENSDSKGFTVTVYQWQSGKAVQVFHKSFSFSTDLSQAYHIYHFEWTATSITFFLDGISLCRYSKTLPLRPMYLWIDNAVARGFQGTIEKASLYIKYIKVYELL